MFDAMSHNDVTICQILYLYWLQPVQYVISWPRFATILQQKSESNPLPAVLRGVISQYVLPLSTFYPRIDK